MDIIKKEKKRMTRGVLYTPIPKNRLSFPKTGREHGQSLSLFVLRQSTGHTPVGLVF